MGTHVVPAWYPRGTRPKICGTLGIQASRDSIFQRVGFLIPRGEVSFYKIKIRNGYRWVDHAAPTPFLEFYWGGSLSLSLSLSLSWEAPIQIKEAFSLSFSLSLSLPPEAPIQVEEALSPL